MAHSFAAHRVPRRLLTGVGVVVSWAAAPAAGAMLDDLLAAADQGRCIESVTFEMIRGNAAGEAPQVVQSALMAHSQRARQQRSLGCEGDIAAQAIAAGADPGQVLEATAAGL